MAKVLHLAALDEGLALRLGPQLRDFVAAGNEVVAASAPGPLVGRLGAAGVRHVPIRPFRPGLDMAADARAFVELVRLFRAERPDIVHTHDPKPSWLGRPAARLAGVPMVINTVHGIAVNRDDARSRRTMIYGFERVASFFSDVELVQNPEDIALLREIGVPASKLVLLGNGIDLGHFDPSSVGPDVRWVTRAELGADASTILVGTVGRLVRRKGIDELADAAARLRSTHPNVRVVVIGSEDPYAGDGLSQTEMDALSSRTGIAFVGPRVDMPAAYAALDVFVLASRREGLSRTVMEASAMGVPVVGTHVRGSHHVITPGETGLITKAGDATGLAHAIGRLVDDPGLRASLGEGGMARAAIDFDQNRSVRVTLEAYAGLDSCREHNDRGRLRRRRRLPSDLRLGARSRPIRVVGFTTSTNRRGAEVFATEVAASLSGPDLEIDLWALQEGTSSPRLDLPVLGRGRRDLRALWKARRLAATADIVLAFGGSTLTLAAAATFGTSVPFIYRQIGDPSFWGDVPLADLRIGLPLRRATKVVSLWQAAADELVRRYRIEPDHITVIPNARDGQAIRPPTTDERLNARRVLELGDEPVVLYLGALSWEKRPADAIEAIGRLPDVHLVVAGDGHLRSELEVLAEKLAPGRVHFLGVVSQALQVLHAADALICPSATEGMAGCILEAGLAGLPVVATDVGSASEVILDGITGRLIPVDDPVAGAAAIAYVLENAAAMGIVARERSVARFVFEVVMPQWEHLLRTANRTVLEHPPA